MPRSCNVRSTSIVERVTLSRHDDGLFSEWLWCAIENALCPVIPIQTQKHLRLQLATRGKQAVSASNSSVVVLTFNYTLIVQNFPGCFDCLRDTRNSRWNATRHRAGTVLWHARLSSFVRIGMFYYLCIAAYTLSCNKRATRLLFSSVRFIVRSDHFMILSDTTVGF